MITALEQVTEHPLCWPDSKQRCAHRVRSKFRATLAKALQEIEWEMARWRVGARWECSRAPAYRRMTGDPGVALWFEMPLRKGHQHRELRVIACDNYDVQEHNAWAVYMTLDALRSVERWGAYSLEQAVEGARAALPPPEGSAEIQWRAVFGEVPGLQNVDALAVVNARYRRMAAESNGNDAELRRLNLAIEQARRELSA